MPISFPNELRYAVCPLCGASTITKIGVISYGKPVLFSSVEVQVEKVPELWKCNGCESAFVQNVLPEELARKLYAEGDSTSRWSTAVFECHKPQEIIAELSRLCRNGRQHLDIGCGGGDLLDFSRERGCITTGIDYSITTKERLELKGHTWFSSFEQLGTKEFDIITAFDVIEHLYEMRKFFDECYRRLKPGGRLVLLTGDIGCQSARSTQARWWYVGYPEHIVFPSRKFFEGLSNFKIERWIPTYASVAYQFPFYRKVLSCMKRIVTMKKYSGMPSWSPDHVLVVLAKE